MGGIVHVAVAGVAIGTVEVALATSMASLIWAGPLAVHLPRAVGVGLLAAVVILAGTSLLTSAPGALGSVQDIPAAILATVAASLAAGLAPAAPSTFLTILLAVSVTSVAVGVFFWLLGRFRLGRLVRYVPYPVVGGFLGGTGVLLSVGSFGVLADTSLAPATVPALLEPGAMARWLPGLGFALLLLGVSRRGGHALVLPGLFVACMAGFHIVLLLTGTQVATAQGGGWLLGPFPDEALWQPWSVMALTGADWPAIAGQAPTMAAVAVFSALGLLLNAGGVELATRRDVDLDQELRAAGLANVAAGLGGGNPGYHAVSLSALAHEMRADHRAVGVVAAGVCAVALLVGAQVLALFPRFVVGGLVLFVGLSLLAEWLLDAWRRLPRADYVVLVLIVAVIAGWGFIPGVLVGLVAAVVLFLVSYSRVSVIKHAFTARQYRSNVDRPAADYEHLREHGDEVQVVTLQGYVFFGTANALYEWVGARVASAAPPLRFLVISFRQVSGLDSSAMQSFDKIRSLAEDRGITLVLTDVRAPLRDVIEVAGLGAATGSVRTLPDVDRGVQWCEDRLLEERRAAAPRGSVEGDWDPAATGLDITRLRPSLERSVIPAGHVLIRQGEDADDLFLLASGQLTVQIARDDGESVRLRTIRPGSVVGELGLYLGTARTAAVVADRRSTVYRLSRAALSDLEADHPQVAAALHAWLARLMARRIADDVRTVTALLD